MGCEDRQGYRVRQSKVVVEYILSGLLIWVIGFTVGTIVNVTRRLCALGHGLSLGFGAVSTLVDN